MTRIKMTMMGLVALGLFSWQPTFAREKMYQPGLEASFGHIRECPGDGFQRQGLADGQLTA